MKIVTDGKSFQPRDPLLRISIFLCILLAIALAAFHFLVFRPSLATDHQIESQLRVAREQNAYLRRISAQYDTADKYRSNLDTLVAKINRRFNSVVFAGRLDAMVKQSGIDLLSQSYSKPSAQHDYKAVDVKLRLRADYKSLRQFLDLMAKSQFYVVLTKGSFKKKDKGLLATLEFEIRSLPQRKLHANA